MQNHWAWTSPYLKSVHWTSIRLSLIGLGSLNQQNQSCHQNTPNESEIRISFFPHILKLFKYNQRRFTSSLIILMKFTAPVVWRVNHFRSILTEIGLPLSALVQWWLDCFNKFYNIIIKSIYTYFNKKFLYSLLLTMYYLLCVSKMILRWHFQKCKTYEPLKKQNKTYTNP